MAGSNPFEGILSNPAVQSVESAFAKIAQALNAENTSNLASSLQGSASPQTMSQFPNLGIEGSENS
jgi:hypothetical protein